MQPQQSEQPTDATGEYLAERDSEHQKTEPLALGATGEFTPAEQDRPAVGAADGSEKPGDATGEYVAGDADPGKPDATGEYVCEQPQAGGAGEATGAYIPGQPEAGGVGEATGAYLAGQPQTGGVGDATGAYLPGTGGASDAGFLTGRRVGNLTGAASAGAFPSEAKPGRIGRYFVKKVAGKGGMGEVLLAEDSDIGRPVALKRMLRGREDQKERFWQEAQVTGQLEHPGVVPVHDLAVDENGQPYYVMKFVHGRTLQDVIKEYHETPAGGGEAKEVQHLRLLNIFLNLCQTIAFAHSRGVIHRDIKPENVMVGAFGETLVLDWGLAKVIGKPEDPSDPFAQFNLSGSFDSMASIAGSIKGTPTYFAPEVAAGKVEDVDKSSDIYLLGATLYHILTGRTPRQAKKLKELLELARTQQPDPPRKIKPEISKPLDAICSRAMARDKADRYESASAVAEDVQRYLAGEPVSAYRENVWERSARWIKKHRTALGRAAAVLVVGSLGLFGYFKVEEIRQEAERQRIEDQAKLEAEQKRADKLAAEDTARKQIKQFHELADEMRYLAANAEPVTEQAPFVDAARAESKGAPALAVADLWGIDLEKMPLADQRSGLKEALYSLLLELAQLKGFQPGAEPARDMLALLDRAELLRTPTRSLYRLRALGLETLEAGKGKSDLQRAADDKIVTTALDHYLQGQQRRRDSTSADNTPSDKKGELTERQKVLTQALDEYRKALALAPEDYWSHFQQASCYWGLGQAAQAVEAFGACAALRPKTPWAFSARALALVSLQRFDEAIEDMDRALKIDAEFRPLRLNRAVVYAGQKRDDEALADFAAALDPPEDKRLPEAYFMRGKFYLDRRQYALALADFDRVVKQKTHVRTVYLHRARIHLVEGNGAQVVDNLTAFLNDGKPADPQDARIHEKVGRELRILAGELDSNNPKNRKLREIAYTHALDQLDRARKLGSQAPALYGEIGAVEELLAALAARERPKEAVRRLREALAAYGKAIELDGKDIKVRIKRGWLHVNLGDNLKGKEDFAAALAIDPQNAEAHTGLGYTQACLKSPVAARRHAALALLHGAGDYLVLHNVACIYATLADKEASQAPEYQDITLDQLQRARELWEKGGKNGPNEVNLIRGEPAFTAPLRSRPEFKKLIDSPP